MIPSALSRVGNDLFAGRDAEMADQPYIPNFRPPLTTEQKVEAIKRRYGLTHGGSKQNKKRKKKTKK